MLRKVGFFGLALVGLALFALVGLQLTGDLRGSSVASAAPAAQSAATLPRTITVVGQGRVASQPDIATAMIGVEVASETVQGATSEAAGRMEKILAALKNQGVADKDIQTRNYSIIYERPAGGMPAVPDKGSESAAQEGVYRVSNMVELKIRDMTRIGKVIDDVVEAGANSIWGVTFALDDTSKIEAEARAKAVEDANARAKELAGLSRVKLGPVLEVSEVIGGGPIAMRYGLESPSSGLKGSGGGGPMVPGELEYTSEIQVTFAIE